MWLFCLVMDKGEGVDLNYSSNSSSERLFQVVIRRT